MLGKVQKAKRVKRHHSPLRQDAKNTHKHLSVYRFIRENGLSSVADVETMRQDYEKAYQQGKARIEELRQEEKPFLNDFRLLSEYERLRPAHQLYEKGHAHIAEIEQAAADFLAIRAEMKNRGYESEEKIKALSEKKADVYEAKDQAKAHQGQVRAVLKNCKDVLQS